MPRIDSALGLYGWVLSAGGTLAVLLFWAMGALFLLQGEGLIAELRLTGGWSTAFWAFPFVALGAVAAGTIAFFAKAYEAAVAVSGLPIVAVAAYYLALVVLR